MSILHGLRSRISYVMDVSEPESDYMPGAGIYEGYGMSFQFGNPVGQGLLDNNLSYVFHKEGISGENFSASNRLRNWKVFWFWFCAWNRRLDSDVFKNSDAEKDAPAGRVE